MADSIKKGVAELNDSVKLYIKAKIDLLKLLLIKKITKSMAFLFETLIIIQLIVLFFIFGGAAFAIWYGSTYHDYLSGVLIITGLILFLLLIFILIGKRMLSSIFISNFSNIFFDDDEDEN